MNSILSSNAVQLWLDTPIGSYYGSPTWGNNFEVLLGKNMNDAPIFLNLILGKMKQDLKEHFQFVEHVRIVDVGNEYIAVAVYYKGDLLAITTL